MTPAATTGALEIFRVFLGLGTTSFGGPVAHLGYLREAFVTRRGWLDEPQFAQLLAICQFLPGPASSQLGFGIGLLRGGWAGALAAFAGFTLPSALLMLAFAVVAPHVAGGPGAAALHGLKLVAVAVVAHGLIGMWRALAPDGSRTLLALAAAALLTITGNAWFQLAAIAGGGVAGLWLCRGLAPSQPVALPVPHGRGAALACLALFAAALLAAIALAVPATGPTSSPATADLASAFYRAGALVFGGGHVVLPLLQQSVVEPGWVSEDVFLAGYGAAQAVPGPMFTLSAFLGAEAWPGTPIAGAAVALAAVFLPGFLLLLAVLPAWSRLVAHPRAMRVVAGINAVVVGLLLAALYDPVLTQGVRSMADALVAAVGLALLAVFGRSALWVVAWCVGATVVLSLVGIG